MTVSTQVSRNEYTGNGATTQYDFTFRIFDKSHLLVQTLDTSESIVTLTLGTDYTVTGVNRYNGGKVVLTSALPAGYKISIERSTPVTQEASIRNQGGFFPEIHEDAFDKLTMLVQQAYGWWSGLSLRKPSWLANYYDALNNRIRNLRDPSQAQDAATKNYVDVQIVDNTNAWKAGDAALDQKIDANFKKSLRIPESYIGALPSVEMRKNKIIAMDNNGNPLMVLPESGSAADVMIELASSAGQLLIGSPRHIEDLRSIFPGVSSRIKTLGALTAYDGGDADWWFDTSDMSVLVSSYPKLFIAPTVDPSGASGAWRLNMGRDVNMSAFGVGISTDYQFNADVLNQFNSYTKGKKYACLPTGKVYISELNFSYDPKFKMEWGVNSELASTRNLGSIDNGTVFIARDADSANPVITIAGTEAKRLSGIYMRNVAIISQDLIDNRDLTIPAEWNVRSNRMALKLDYIASAIDIGTLTICGFKQALFGSELWDGSIRRLAVSICSDPDGTVPAVWLGSQHGDNSNALKFYDMRIEHCPFSLECGFIEHVRFINGKIETKRKKDATHYVVKINDNATRYHFDGMQFVTTPTTKTPYLYDQGQWPVYNECDFTVGGIVGNYPGVRWIYRSPTRTSVAKFKALTITGPMQADGADPAAYPMYLADYDEFGGSIQCQDTYTIDGVAVYPSYQGLICMGTGTKMGSLHINTNNITKTAGSVFYARGGDYDIGKPTITGAPHNLLAGVKNDIRKMITSSPDIEIYRRETILLNPGTALNSMKGFEGQVIRVMTFGTGCTITHSSLINNSSGANISMTANTVYTFMMLTGTVAKQI